MALPRVESYGSDHALGLRSGIPCHYLAVDQKKAESGTLRVTILLYSTIDLLSLRIQLPTVLFQQNTHPLFCSAGILLSLAALAVPQSRAEDEPGVLTAMA